MYSAILYVVSRNEEALGEPAGLEIARLEFGTHGLRSPAAVIALAAGYVMMRYDPCTRVDMIDSRFRNDASDLMSQNWGCDVPPAGLFDISPADS